MSPAPARIADRDARDEASHIISGWQKDTLGQRMADMAAEMLPARHPEIRTAYKPVYLMEYVCGALVELGFYSSARLAKQASDVGKWIELPDGGWRSEDGRSLIVSEVR